MLLFSQRLEEKRRREVEGLRGEWADQATYLDGLADDAEPTAAKLREIELLLQRTGRGATDLEASILLVRRRREIEAELATRPQLQAEMEELLAEMQRLVDSETAGRADCVDREHRLKQQQREAFEKLRSAPAPEKAEHEKELNFIHESLNELNEELRTMPDRYLRWRAEARTKQVDKHHALVALDGEKSRELQRIIADQEAALPQF